MGEVMTGKVVRVRRHTPFGAGTVTPPMHPPGRRVSPGRHLSAGARYSGPGAREGGIPTGDPHVCPRSVTAEQGSAHERWPTAARTVVAVVRGTRSETAIRANGEVAGRRSMQATAPRRGRIATKSWVPACSRTPRHSVSGIQTPRPGVPRSTRHHEGSTVTFSTAASGTRTFPRRAATFSHQLSLTISSSPWTATRAMADAPRSRCVQVLVPTGFLSLPGEPMSNAGARREVVVGAGSKAGPGTRRVFSRLFGDHRVRFRPARSEPQGLCRSVDPVRQAPRCTRPPLDVASRSRSFWPLRAEAQPAYRPYLSPT